MNNDSDPNNIYDFIPDHFDPRTMFIDTETKIVFHIAGRHNQFRDITAKPKIQYCDYCHKVEWVVVLLGEQQFWWCHNSPWCARFRCLDYNHCGRQNSTLV